MGQPNLWRSVLLFCHTCANGCAGVVVQFDVGEEGVFWASAWAVGPSAPMVLMGSVACALKVGNGWVEAGVAVAWGATKGLGTGVGESQMVANALPGVRPIASTGVD